MSVVLSTSPSRKVHEINVKSKNGRAFVVDIYEQTKGKYESTVTVLDRVSPNPGSWLYDVTLAAVSGNDNFNAAVQLINQYLAAVDPADAISDVHNSCNCPFVQEQDQNQILSTLGINFQVRVN